MATTSRRIPGRKRSLTRVFLKGVVLEKPYPLLIDPATVCQLD